MTAEGKINASTVRAGDRILFDTERVSFARTKTGENVTTARVIAKTFRAAKGPYEQKGKYIIETTAGVFEAAGIQTMFLAPESGAGLKRAHVEAIEMNEKFDADKIEAKKQINWWLKKHDVRLRGSSDEAIAKCAADYHEAVARDFREALREDAERKAPEFGDTIERRQDGRWLRVMMGSRNLVAYEGFGRDLTVGAVNRDAFHQFFRVVASDAWTERAERCSNEWHRTAPQRMRMLCPDCPR